jgi:hypothetical protein
VLAAEVARASLWCADCTLGCARLITIGPRTGFPPPEGMGHLPRRAPCSHIRLVDVRLVRRSRNSPCAPGFNCSTSSRP